MVKDLIGNNNLPQEAICIDNYEDACALQQILMKNGYVVMMGREENLYTLNWIWSQNGADRNDVIFYPRDIYEYDLIIAQKEKNQID